jgi:hypothetical protein
MPSDLIWKPFTPLLQRVEPLQGAADRCMLYLPGCIAGATGVAALMLMGVVLATRKRPAPAPAAMRDAVPA